MVLNEWEWMGVEVRECGVLLMLCLRDGVWRKGVAVSCAWRGRRWDYWQLDVSEPFDSLTFCLIGNATLFT